MKQRECSPPSHTQGARGCLSERGSQSKSAFQAGGPSRQCRSQGRISHLLRRVLCNLREKNLPKNTQRYAGWKFIISKHLTEARWVSSSSVTFIHVWRHKNSPCLSVEHNRRISLSRAPEDDTVHCSVHLLLLVCPHLPLLKTKPQKSSSLACLLFNHYIKLRAMPGTTQRMAFRGQILKGQMHRSTCTILCEINTI